MSSGPRVRRRDATRRPTSPELARLAVEHGTPLPHPAVVATLRDLGLRVCGLSFQVGSQVADPSRYVEAIDACRELARLPATVRVTAEPGRCIASPTCDGIDLIREDRPLPELDIGDLVVGRMMGACAAASATDFNFTARANVVAVNRESGRHRAG